MRARRSAVPIVVGLWAALLPLVVPPPGPVSHQPGWPLSITLEGNISRDDYEHQVERTFTVPPGARRITVALTHTGAGQRTVIDLGLRDPVGLRGWSGGREKTIVVSDLTATRGYLPGRMVPGEWAVILGIANIRAAQRDRYTLTITIDNQSSVGAPTIREGAGWYAGDLHAHSGHSDGRSRAQSGHLVPGAVDRVFEAAADASLDFVTLSDHNTAAHWLDVDRLQPNYDRMLLLHGREITTYRGHANTVNERDFLDFRLWDPTRSPVDILRRLTAQGAFVSINHPTRADDESCMGCGWNVADAEVMQTVQGIEVVNGNKRSGQLFGWSFWADQLNRGHRLTAVGGSDDHTPDVRDDYDLGAPTTVVWAEQLSEAAIAEGLRSGRVYLRTRGSAGPQLDFTATGADGVVAQMGQTLTPGRLTLRAAVIGADGATLEWIRRGTVLGTTTLGVDPAVLSVDAVSGDWFSLIVRDGADPILISNPVYVR